MAEIRDMQPRAKQKIPSKDQNRGKNNNMKKKPKAIIEAHGKSKIRYN